MPCNQNASVLRQHNLQSVPGLIWQRIRVARARFESGDMDVTCSSFANTHVGYILMVLAPNFT